MPESLPPTVGDAVELFAGVGGFRIALERSHWRVAWSDQWEPATRKQHASECYERNFTDGIHVCEDITKVLDDLEAGGDAFGLPEHFDLLVGGFPCQDYSVAKSASQAHGIVGKKGVLWWQIHRLLEARRPPYFLLENVDRLLNSPASQRGRDFAIMLASVSDLGYAVEWRVVNAADYGFPQKRRRVFLVGVLHGMDGGEPDPQEWLTRTGVTARALPAVQSQQQTTLDVPIGLDGELVDISATFGRGLPVTPFRNCGLMVHRKAWTLSVRSAYEGPYTRLKDVLEPEAEVPEAFFVNDPDELASWRYLKGAKHEPRKHRGTGTEYFYSEGAIPYPDDPEGPARTILTGEGGGTPSRFKHLIPASGGRMRRLTPRELERLNGFPVDWTAGMPDAKRAFCMGNALVVGVVELLAASLAEYAKAHRAEAVTA